MLILSYQPMCTKLIKIAKFSSYLLLFPPHRLCRLVMLNSRDSEDTPRGNTDTPVIQSLTKSGRWYVWNALIDLAL